MSVGDDSS